MPTKGDKCKWEKKYAPLVKVPKFKLVKQTCQGQDGGMSGMEFKAEKIYSGKYLERDEYRTGGLTHKPDKQVTALKKTLKNSLAKGWTLNSISDDFGGGDQDMNYDNLPMGWTARLSYINHKTQVAVFADLNVSVGHKLNSTSSKGTSWVTISVTNLHQEFWE